MTERSRALITGASSGIGAAVARRLAVTHDLWLAARRQDRLTALVRQIHDGGGRAHAVALDVSRPDETAETVANLDGAIGGFDLVLANAGIAGSGRVSATSYAGAAAVITTNTLGALATLLPVVPGMIERARGGRRGHLAAVSSMAAEVPIPVAADYGTSKAALSFFLRSAQGELPALGVDVTLIHPGFVKSELTDANSFQMPFMLETDAAARIIVDGLAQRARLIRFPFAMGLLSTLGALLPRAVSDRVTLGKASGKGGSKGGGKGLQGP